LAEKESCIIVGRCADYVLKDNLNAVHVYIYASYADRLANCVGTLGMEKNEAKRMIADVDKARLAYHKHFAKYAPGDPKHKHVIINSALLEVEGTAQALATIIRQKFALPDSAK
jgi:cytidylate kinase